MIWLLVTKLRQPGYHPAIMPQNRPAVTGLPAIREHRSHAPVSAALPPKEPR